MGYFCQFGKVGRVFLQPDTKGGGLNEKGSRNFTEGWVEFLSKSVAKQVAKELNTTPVGGKRRSKAHNQLWNIKYLPRFKWTHLSERLAYEAAVRQQRLRTEISQVKREADHFKTCVEQKKKQKKSKRDRSESNPNYKPFEFEQKETDAAVRKRKKEDAEDVESGSPPMKRKKTKKSKSEKAKKKGKESKKKLSKKEEEKSKKSKKLGKDKRREGNCMKNKRGDKEDRVARRRSSAEGNDRSEFLKSVFGGK